MKRRSFLKWLGAAAVVAPIVPQVIQQVKPKVTYGDEEEWRKIFQDNQSEGVYFGQTSDDPRHCAMRIHGTFEDQPDLVWSDIDGVWYEKKQPDLHVVFSDYDEAKNVIPARTGGNITIL